ncbi:MAG TPA: arylsulfatase [Chthoniobacteraceae bacterium]|jgi:arylsulfatase A-like enzyme|nr:arylsulfatase [Chthoniobacteraceae bacterium]
MKFLRLLLALGLAWVAAAAAEPRPNIVILLADDQGWGDLSLNGNTNVHTPQIDSIGRAGAVLDRFFVCPVCAPTRAEMLTGRYHSRGGVRGVSTGQERLNLDERTLAETFLAAGYATGAFGKWHNGSQWPYHPNARGFQEFYGFTSGHWGEYFDPPLEHNGRPVRGRGYIADDLTDHALAFIEQNQTRPFLCYLPWNTPHSPFCVPDEYWDRFKDRPLTMRARDEKAEDLDSTRCVLAMAENLDANVGRVLRRLDELKLAENTIVLYFSDNGPNTERWNGDMKGRKGSTDEGGVRAPFVIRWPGKIAPGTQVREIAGAIDLLPTLASLAGVPLLGTKPLDGRDLSPLLRGAARDWPDRMIFSHQNGKLSVRTQRHRLDDRGALFDLETDPGQRQDIAAQQPALAAQLRQAEAAFRAEALPIGKDERPFPVGYPEFPMTPLPARDGVPHGGIQRSASAPNCSYFVNWKTPADSMTWDVDIHTAGDYEVTLLYTCPEADAGSTIELSFNNSTLRGKVTPAWDPPLITGQDRVPRKGESIMKEFHPLTLGAIKLEKGRGLLTLRAVEIPGSSVMDVRLVSLSLKEAGR